jgi:hypothetical protein
MSYFDDERGLKHPSVSGVAPHDSLRTGRDKRHHVLVDGVIGGELTLPFAGNCKDLMDEDDLVISPRYISSAAYVTKNARPPRSEYRFMT